MPSEGKTVQDEYIGPVSARLQDLPELTQLTHNMKEGKRTIPVLKAFLGYTRRAIEELVRLTPEDLKIIAAVNDRMGKMQGADRFLETLGSHREVLSTTIEKHFTPGSPAYEEGLKDLSARMHEAQDLKALNPNDGDPRFANAIWAYTKIEGPQNNPKTMLHAVMGHLIERVTNQITLEDGTRIIAKKDDLLNALGDTIGFREAQRGEKSNLHSLYELWNRPKSEGGLGWINNEKMTAFKEALDAPPVIYVGSSK